MGLDDYAQALGAAQALVPNWRDGDIREAQLSGLQIQNTANQQAATDAHATVQFKQARQQAFSAALSNLGAKPTPQNYRSLAVQFPEFHEGIESAAKGLDQERAATLVRHLAPVQALISAGQYDTAASEVKRHIDADVAASGQADESDQELYDALSSKDPARQKAAGGIAYALLTQLNPETAAKNIGDRIGDQTHVVTQGGALVDNSGKVLFQAAPAQSNALEVPIFDDQGKRIGTQLVSNGGKGGDPASGGGAAGGSAAPAGRYTGGWTPRARNGGDNTDAQVDNKIAGSAKTLGLDPDAPFPPGMSNLDIAKAMAFGEGGAGTIAGRNNNPTNLRDAKSGAYRQFGSTDAALTAAAAQVARNRKRGQNSVRAMIEGLPVGGLGGSASTAPGYIGPVKSGSGDNGLEGPAYLATLNPGRRALLQAIARGDADAPKPGSRFGEALAEDLQRSFPGTDTTNFATRRAAMKAFTSGKEGATVRSLNVAIDHLGVLHDAAMALRNGDVPLFNKLSQRWQTATGGPLPNNAKAVAGIVADEVVKAVVGSGGALADREDLKHTLDVAGSPDQIVGITRQYITLMGGQARGLQLQYEQATGNKDFHRFLNPTTRKLLGVHGGSGGPGGGGPTRVTTVQQAMALSKGTIFIDPRGVRRVR